MSAPKKASSIAALLGGGDCEYVASNSDVEVTVIRSADGKTSKITIPLSSTLNALKDAIHVDQTLGPIKRNQQRLFHLGRELKSGNRSLSALGIGKHNVFSIHLHSLAPKTVDLQSDDDEEGSEVKRRISNNHVGNSNHGGVIDLASSGNDASGDPFRDTSDGIGRWNHENHHYHQLQQFQQQQVQQQVQHHQQMGQQRRNRGEREKVVELLDSDSDDDVEIIETVPKRRRRN
eukprot:CAMPEP_0183730206 /NCGR_PEP_ID=MMETSP0737-20130205/32250_1 /TAXON_ID=385413 /ORGANISM="Thalassiosira miniscula, Strain CCMP1093" /LENGTH=232 /DNA_ID=CAMNT_0025962639 /DNA_START=92 /DNA_END=790 /DNA_ORIENTATION=+